MNKRVSDAIISPVPVQRGYDLTLSDLRATCSLAQWSSTAMCSVEILKTSGQVC